MRLKALDLSALKLSVVLYGTMTNEGEAVKTIAIRFPRAEIESWRFREVENQRVPANISILEQDEHAWIVVRRGKVRVLLYPPSGGYLEIFPAGASCSCKGEIMTKNFPAFLEHDASGMRTIRFEDSVVLPHSVL